MFRKLTFSCEIKLRFLSNLYLVTFSGQYWIDPNEGAHEDAEQAYCDFERNATCLEPVRNKVCTQKI